MSRKRRSRGSSGGGLYKEPTHEDIAKIITFESISGARKAARVLLDWVKRARREKALAIVRALNYAANRAKATAKNHPTFSAATRRKWAKISKIYRAAFERADKIYKARFGE